MNNPRLLVPAVLVAADGSVRPGDLVGFNPQPDPPGDWFVLLPKITR
jgi:hypothetical protein